MIKKEILENIGSPYEEVKDGVYFACVQPAYLYYPEYFNVQLKEKFLPDPNFTTEEFNNFFADCLLNYTTEIDIDDIGIGDVFLLSLPIIGDAGRFHLGVRVEINNVAISFKDTGLTLLKWDKVKHRIKRGFRV